MEWRPLGDVLVLAGARAALAHGDALFVAGAGGKLWRVDPVTLDATPFGDPAIHARLLAAVRAHLFVFDETGVLHAVDAASGAHRTLDGEWSGVRAACGRGATLLACGGALVEIDPEGSGFRPLGEHEWRPQLLTADEDSLYILEEDGGLHRVTGEDGEHHQLDGEWGDVASGAARRRGLVLGTDEGSLYTVTPDGTPSQLPCGVPPGARWLISAGPLLYAALADGALHVLTLDD